MANSGSAATKFVSVNLNKSYGQPSHHGNPSFSGSYGQAAANRGRSGAGGGGMVVLSRSRTSQKAGPKLSVPPPLNLPSLRKEHERFDLPGSGGGTVGVVTVGNGQRPGSSGAGWTKPAPATPQDKDTSTDAQVADVVEQSAHHLNGVNAGTGAYLPPSARFGGTGVAASGSGRPIPAPPERVSVLRGEDFPSLQAALPVSSGHVQKSKDGLSQKQKQGVVEDSISEQKDGYHSSSLVDMQPQGQSSHHIAGTGSLGNGIEVHGSGSSRGAEESQKQDYFPSLLPLVRLNPRSDWADDERDTGQGFVERVRDNGFVRKENFWDKDFDIPRPSAIPQRAAFNQHEKWGQRDDETGKNFSSGVLKSDSYRRDVRTPSREDREGNLWRTSMVLRDGVNSGQEVSGDRNPIGARSAGLNKDIVKDNRYVPPHFGDTARDSGVRGTRESMIGRRDVEHAYEGRQHWNQSSESQGSRGAEHISRDFFSNENSTRHRSESSQNNQTSRPSFAALSGKTSLTTDPKHTLGRERRNFSKSERPYLDDPFLKEFGSAVFDERDPFSAALVGVIKRKKDAIKQTDFHDPVRESFEAELERVQKMQELERQRIIEEQEKALEQARREEEERQRIIIEEEERRLRLEEEAREAAWRAEQGRLEAMRRAEEQKLAREEEKRKIILEEERRKQAAKQMLLELEAKMAMRQAETVKDDTSAGLANFDEKMPVSIKEKDISRVDNQEESNKVGERITTSVSIESPIISRPFEMTSRSYSSIEPSNLPDRGKPYNSWRRDMVEKGSSSSLPLQDYEVSSYSSRPDGSTSSRISSRKEIYGATENMSSRAYLKGGQEPFPEEFLHQKEQKWGTPGDAESFHRSRDMVSEFHDNLGDNGWNQGRSRGNIRFPYPEQSYHNMEADEPYSYGRSRYSVRQPRVLPPPSFATMQRTSFRGLNERSSSSNFLDDHNHSARTDSARQAGYYRSPQETLGASELVNVPQQSINREDHGLEEGMAERCDSQSSLSVTSPPNSPPHLSNDELDEPGDSPLIAAASEGKILTVSGNESVSLNDVSGKDNVSPASSSLSAIEDDEWAIANNDELQQQVEYDEDEEGYQEEDEVREGDDDLELNQDFEDLHLVQNDSSHLVQNLVLGFDEGVEVGIPNDEFDVSSRNEEVSFGVPGTLVHAIEEKGSMDAMQADDHGFHAGDDSCQTAAVGSSGRIQGEKPVLEAAIKSSNPCTPETTDLLDAIDHSSSSGLLSQQTATLADISTSDGQTVTTSVSTVPSQGEMPVKLQFGLFSGPSLIPSPIPAIQIGSIQMPLHLHPSVGPSVGHMHPSQPPIFQFGQLRYTSPISQGILPLAPQSVSFVQHNIQAHYLNQNAAVSLPIQSTHDTSKQRIRKDDAQSPSLSQQVPLESSFKQSHDIVPSGLACGSVTETTESMKVSADVVIASDKMLKAEACVEVENKGQLNAGLVKESGAEGQSQSAHGSSHFISSEKSYVGLKGQAPISGSRGKRFTYAVKNSSSRPLLPAPEAFRSDATVFHRRQRRTVQRTEFRIKDNKLSSSLMASHNSDLDDRTHSNGRAPGIFLRSGSKRATMSHKPLKQTFTQSSAPGIVSSQDHQSGFKGKEVGKDTLGKSQKFWHSGDGTGKRSMIEEDVDAPLQSGVVRVFKQSGIEAPSDEDDFIEVRSKRQMLNDRREQREKEIKAKSRTIKLPRKARATKQGAALLSSPSRTSAQVSGALNNLQSNAVIAEGQALPSKDISTGFTSTPSQPMAPIGTPASSCAPNGPAVVNFGAQADGKSHSIKSLQAGSTAVALSGSNSIASGLTIEGKSNNIENGTPSSPSSWESAGINQQVMALTQTQLEEAMKPGCFDAHVASVGSQSSTISDPVLPSSSILTKDKSYSSASSPINSLLAGEKIQFGAVTSPTLLPPSSRVVSHGIGAPGSNRSEMQISRNISAADNDCALFFDKDKRHNDSCLHLQDCEAEAEAAASAVAVAAISSDEIVGNGLGSVIISETKTFGGPNVDGVAGDKPSGNQSRTEETLSVSLPADLSVETPPISLWPPLPSPQSSSSPMLSHFPAGPPSHFPFYEMNPMLGGPIFAYGPHEESSGSQSQPQKTSASTTGPISTWPHHSSVDSFYGPPAGFTGPFISPPGGIAGVQGPPHMVVYNHFAPVGQFGQVGLSYMGTTYIPSGKQPDWKHNASSSAVPIGEADMNNISTVSAQRGPQALPGPVQHLAPGSPLLPMASPLAMFDVSPFQFHSTSQQSTPDMTVQARWSHVPSSPLHSVPLSRPLQQPVDGVMPSQFGHGPPIEQSISVNRLSESRSSTPSDKGPVFTVPNVNATQFPEELGLVGSSQAMVSSSSTQPAVNQISGPPATDGGKSDTLRNNSGNTSKSQSGSAFKAHAPQQKNVAGQQSPAASYSHQRGGAMAQRNSGNEWTHRRASFHGRSQPLSAERGFASKTKQIYVAKQSTAVPRSAE